MCACASVCVCVCVCVFLQEGQDLEFECAKKIIELDCLCSKEGDSDHKITDQLEFTSKESFDKFWNWFCPTT